MPLYEYDCQIHGRFEKLERTYNTFLQACPHCGHLAQKLISLSSWHMGWKFLKDRSEKSLAAPSDAGYYPEWDQAYASYKGEDTIKV